MAIYELDMVMRGPGEPLDPYDESVEDPISPGGFMPGVVGTVMEMVGGMDVKKGGKDKSGKVRGKGKK